MNKEQYKQYRRNQRICDDNEWGYPDNNAEYWNRIPLQRVPQLFPPRHTLSTDWEMYKHEYEYVDKPGSEYRWQKIRVPTGKLNPRRAESIRAEMKRRYTPF